MASSRLLPAQCLRGVVLLCLVLIGARHALAQTNISVTRHIVYANPVANAALQALDVYRTPNVANRPVMVYVHGGAWSIGDKANVDAKPSGFINDGFVFVSINYRLSPQVAFPAHAEDVAAAIAWVRANIAQYGGDPARIFLMGHSAGCHLVALVATDQRYLAKHGMALAELGGVIALDTQGYDIPEYARINGSLPDEYLKVFGTDVQSWGNASPSTYVAPNKNIPPMAVAYSKGLFSNEAAQRRELSTQFATQLTTAGIANRLIDGSAQSHLQINENFGVPGDAVSAAALSFLRSTPSYGNAAQGRLWVEEFYNAPLNHYFMSADVGERMGLSTQAALGWTPTQRGFFAQQSVLAGALSVCRFYGSMSPGPNSHFYTGNASECDFLKQLQATTPASQPRWNYEGLAFQAVLPINGAGCPAATPRTVVRAYNNRAAQNDSNHRYLTDATEAERMRGLGWSLEGAVFCSQ
jgi:arylformamidase